MAQQFDAVHAITKHQKNWTIKVRVVRMWDTPPFPKNCPNNGIDLVLCDKDEGGVYILSEFNVVAANTSFRPTIHDYKMNFQFQTRIAQTTDDDVIGLVCNVYGVNQSNPDDGKTKRVTIDVEDAQKTMLSITLWGHFVDQIVDFMANWTGAAVVVIIQFCKIKEYSGTRSLTNSMYATRMYINSDLEEVLHFHQCLQPEDMTSPINPNGTTSMVIASPIDGSFTGVPLIPVDEIHHRADGSVSCIIAQVVGINSEKGWYYDACKKCAKKLDPDGSIFFCNKCQVLVNACTTRYKLELMVMDEFGTTNITVFDRDVANFITMPAVDLLQDHIQVSNWNGIKSFTAQRLTNDPVITDKFMSYRFAKSKDVNKSDVVGSSVETTSVIDIAVRPLTFPDGVASPYSVTTSSGKRSSFEKSGEGYSSTKCVKNLDISLKKIKLEKI
ncbi:replication protein A 70 kDa DNA-binding subunit C-like [Senna tora]|uniref:Replication protein A 70 kDa DNA-binding subunit C-like n=1 Tax=Senna tora TaxID=362788 RepID=A0A834X1B0_9FABA|nr:replication protein A 70 kDa DNA-binding subunit C-like [Senna tora]